MRNPQTDRGVANQRSGQRLQRKCKCGRTITGNAAWWSHLNSAAAQADPDAHGYAGRGAWPRPDPGPVHLMDEDLLDTCGTAPAGVELHVAPDTTPERITCPRCCELLQKAAATVAAEAAVQTLNPAPPVHGPGRPETFGRGMDPGTASLLERGRRAIVRAEQLRRSAALRLLPPGGTLHA